MFQKVLLALFAFGSFSLAAQNTKLSQASWQQRVDYRITVTLDDSNNVLNGAEVISYQNNSPDALGEIYIHLWPNAYLNNGTPYGVQSLENGETDFYYSNRDEKGRIDSLSFKVNGQRVKVEFLYGKHEICRLILNKPLLSNQKLEIATSFRVKLPKIFSRLGHEKQLYCITQWYPKPAVYDVNGWNMMSYLDQGEFYSEFGRFDVSITAPKDYVVVATGEVQDDDERKWWLSRTRSVLVAHPSTKPMKTLRFIQDSVHDFAWFASKKFKTGKSEVVLSNGQKVDTWMFAEKEKEGDTLTGMNYLNSAISFYSNKVGVYPYKLATVVVTPLKAGGGMEYPTITNVTTIERQVIVHELGHNWFYGILGTNERKYPWMDESINNYYEARSTYESKVVEHGGLIKSGRFSLDNLAPSSFGLLELQYLFSARNNTDQAPFLSSEAFTHLNYGTVIYSKASLAFLQLQKYLGDDVFDGMMKSYYDKWKFKHPLPNDFINHVKAYTGKDKELDWFFVGLMSESRKPDYAICRVKKRGDSIEVVIKNKGGVAAPISVQTIDGLLVKNEVKVEPFVGKTVVKLPTSSASEVRIDAKEEALDVYRNNNYARVNGLLKTYRKIEVMPFLNLEKPQYQQVYYSPIIGANLYNKTMLGMAFYNSLIPRKKTEYVLAPMYAFGTKDLTGYFNIHRRFFTQGKIREFQLGLDVARFGTADYTDGYLIREDSLGPIYGQEFVNRVYEKVAPRITIFFASANPRTDAEKSVNIRYVMINEQVQTSSLFKDFNKHYGYLNARYSQVQSRKVNPYSLHIDYQLGQAESQFQKITAEFQAFVDYGEEKKGLLVRAFAGGFIQKPGEGKDTRTYFRLADNNGYYDYLYDESQFGRGNNRVNESTLFTQQLMPGTTGFRTYALAVGATDSWVGALNFTSTIPGVLPLRIFADVAGINAKQLTTNGNTNQTTITYTANVHYVTGVSIWPLRDILQVNFPLFTDAVTQERWDQQNSYWQRITFSLKLNALNPIKQIREAKLF